MGKSEHQASHSKLAAPVAVAFRVVARAAIAFVVWVVLGALMFLSALPYGGGSKLLTFLFTVATFVLPIWVIAAFFKSKE